ncbi:hypothetical protein C0991_002059 [Blastosporella zonata]|nr:hypothetical protein C0991_002059 [Blastosporella zonata]
MSYSAAPSNTITLPAPGNYSGALHNCTPDLVLFLIIPIAYQHLDLQERKQAHLLSWVETPTLGSNSTQWTVHCKINGEIKGTGVALQKAAARQAAAKQACE